MRRPLLAALLLAVLPLVGCGSNDDGSTPAATNDAPAADTQPVADASGRRGIAITLRSSQFGRVLFGNRKRAIYIFDLERTKRARCYGDCAVAWPPVLTKGRPVAGRGIDRSLLGTTKRRDGKTQATYNGHPLYYYVNDPAGVVGCHNIREFGGVWLAVRADGNRAP